jgi:hypothetical protein
MTRRVFLAQITGVCVAAGAVIGIHVRTRDGVHSYQLQVNGRPSGEPVHLFSFTTSIDNLDHLYPGAEICHSRFLEGGRITKVSVEGLQLHVEGIGLGGLA